MIKKIAKKDDKCGMIGVAGTSGLKGRDDILRRRERVENFRW